MATPMAITWMKKDSAIPHRLPNFSATVWMKNAPTVAPQKKSEITIPHVASSCSRFTWEPSATKEEFKNWRNAC